MTDNNNENWTKCPRCGSPVMISAETGEPEPCANCRSQSSPWGLYLGGFAVIAGLGVIVYLIYIAIRVVLMKH